ncbi:MAG: diguanylate cyclase (GGDEF)-like protein/PAS domain S-box-containing protein [Paraglaciecola sp.]|jgi:diguanylate cyclase (GGDEF)-like protein/PAS domain S-box-containing protein
MNAGDKFSQLRKRAENIIKTTSNSAIIDKNSELFRLLHELDTYKIELELQNEDLHAANTTLNILHDKLKAEIAIHYRHFDIAPVGYITLDSSHNIVEINQTLVEQLKLAKSDFLGKPFNHFIFSEDKDKFYLCSQKLLNKNKQQTCELRLCGVNVAPFWVKLNCSPEVRDIGFRIHIAISDISHLKEMEKRLRLDASVLNECAEVIVVTDAKGRITRVNKAFTKVTGYTEAEMLGESPDILLAEKIDKSLNDIKWDALHKNHRWQGEIWNKRKNGEIYPEWISLTAVKNTGDAITHYISVSSDITKRKRDADHIHFMAYYDTLTGLPNRVLLQDRLKQALVQSHRNHHHGAVFILDIDHFKVVNDSLGHLIGDELLKAIANRLSGCIREEDTISRMGGDEFVILLADLGEDKQKAISYATNVADKVIQNISEPITVSDNKLQITVSIGIAMFPDDTDNITELVKLADNAMYKVKKFGRNNYAFVTPSLQKAADKRLSIQHGLNEALKKNQFRLLYQPQVNFKTLTISGVEALIRWQTPHEGLVYPNDFIKISEETGLIIPIGTWVLEEACRTISAWNKLSSPPSPYLSVNVSVRQFQQKHFISEIRRLILAYNVEPQQLELELTESVLIHDLKYSKKKLFELKEMGIRLAIDDFGTGYSSLKYLKNLPIDVLKIDQFFINDLTMGGNDEAIVQTIITLAKNLNLWVVAEGVVSKNQYDYLKLIGCDSYQGYYYSKPVPGDELLVLIAGNSQIHK